MRSERGIPFSLAERSGLGEGPCPLFRNVSNFVFFGIKMKYVGVFLHYFE